jgi:hypothetical protein
MSPIKPAPRVAAQLAQGFSEGKVSWLGGQEIKRRLPRPECRHGRWLIGCLARWRVKTNSVRWAMCAPAKRVGHLQ